MKITLAAVLAALALRSLSHAAPTTFFGQDLNTLPPAGPGSDNPTRLTVHPEADEAANRFLSRLVGVATETFESFPDQSSPAMLTFGPDTATLTGGPVVYNVPTNTFNGTFPISGDQFLLLVAQSSSFFRINFSTPQAAFGFYATDVEVAQLRITLVATNGNRTELTVPTFSAENPTLPTGSVLFFGVIDTEAPFVTVEFARIGASVDGFGFDNMTIGRVGQVGPPRLDIRVSERLDGRVSEVELSWASLTNETYRVDFRSDLTTIVWTPLTCTAGDGTTKRVYDLVPVGALRRFYRLAVTNCVPDL
jgi:hypothetical protein